MMDPNQALADALDLATKILNESDDGAKNTTEHDEQMTILADRMCAHDLAESFAALDGWIRSGGFLPRDWQETEIKRKLGEALREAPATMQNVVWTSSGHAIGCTPEQCHSACRRPHR